MANGVLQFMTGLIRLESGITALRVAYAEHLNTFLPQGHPSRLVLPSFGGNYEGADLNNVAGAAAGAGPRFGRGDTPAGGLGAADPSKKKKRKPHDPNAPKRALTSYFLFMAENKPAIKAANDGWTSQQVSEESERRWQNISPTEKAVGSAMPVTLRRLIVPGIRDALSDRPLPILQAEGSVRGRRPDSGRGRGSGTSVV
jgi:hypothetical protein